MSQVNTCLHCGREVGANPYLGDTNPDHVLEIRDVNAPSMEILHGEDREYDAFCGKEHYIAWLRAAKKRLEGRTPEGQDESHGPSL